jgi:hypothetical protein
LVGSFESVKYHIMGLILDTNAKKGVVSFTLRPLSFLARPAQELFGHKVDPDAVDKKKSLAAGRNRTSLIQIVTQTLYLLS